MPLALCQAGPEDASEYAHVYIGAFIVDSLHDAVFKEMPFEEQVARATELWPRFYHSPTLFTQLVKDTDRGEIIAFARWSISNCPHVMKRLRGDELDLSIDTTTPPLIIPQGLDEKLLSRFVAQANEKKIKHMDSRPFMHLDLLGTLSNHYRRGGSSMLLQWMCDFTDKEGIACYVESSEMARRLYEKFGYVTKDEIYTSWEGGGSTHYCMVREPKSRDA